MSRVMQRAAIGVPAATIQDVLTCPADHKYELLNVAVQSQPDAAQVRGSLVTVAPFSVAWFTMDIGSPLWVLNANVGAFVLYPGDKISGYSSVHNGFIFVTYIDVDFD